MKLKGKNRRILSGPESIDQGLTHEQANSDPNGDSYHCSANIYTTAVGSYPPSLRQTRLGKVLTTVFTCNGKTYRNKKQHTSDH